MIEITAKPERTFALVVGIAKYQESSWNIKSGATVEDALKFACWLRGQGVPTDNIKLCLSPLEENQELLNGGLSLEGANLQNIDNIITNFLSQKTGDLLYIFWAGHGLITSERERRLFCADVTKQNWQNIDLNSLLLLLSSDLFKIRNHICIIDACANYLLETQGRPTNLGGKEFNSGKPRTDSQNFVLLATREGEKAKVSAESKTGYFSQAVRSALEQAPSEIFPPDMKAIAEEVKQHFARLKKNQLPTYMYYRSWDGDIDKNYLNPFEIPHNIPQDEIKEFIDREKEFQDLHKLFQENDVVAITDATGKGGVGKSELAKQYAWRKLEDYGGGCFWLDAEKADYLGTRLINLSIANFNFNFPQELDIEGKIQYCWRNWQPGKVLLVFDNVTDWAQIKPYLPPKGSRFKVLITTRQTSLPYPSLQLGGLPPDAALELFINLMGKESIEEDLASAEGICKFVHYIPLALYLMVPYARREAREVRC